MMLFGVEWNRGRPARPTGLLSAAGILGAGRLALLWWRNRRGASGRTAADSERERNPIHGWQ